MALLRSMWSGFPSKSLALLRYKQIHIYIAQVKLQKNDRCENSEHQSVRKHVCWQMQATLLKSCWQIKKIFYARTPWNVNTQPVQHFHFTILSLRSVRFEARAPLHVCRLLRGPLQPSLLCSLPCLALAWRALLHLPQLPLRLDWWNFSCRQHFIYSSSQSLRMFPCPPCSSLSSLFSSSCLEWTCPGLRWWKVSSCYVFQLKQPGGYILLVRARCSAPLDDSPPRLPREAHPDRRHHLRGQPQDQLLQLGLAAELEGGARGALVPRACQPLRQVEVAPQWGDLGHPKHLEVRGAQEQMRLGRPWPSGSRVQQ